MNHDDDNDIARLFSQFGGDPDTYQEIASVAAAREARSRWPLLSAIDPLPDACPPVMGADDAEVVAHAVRSAESASGGDQASQANQAEEPASPAQFIPPRRGTFNHEVPAAFMVPAATAPMRNTAVEPAAEATPEDASSPSAAIDPFRRLAARPAAGNESNHLPDLFKRLLSS